MKSLRGVQVVLSAVATVALGYCAVVYAHSALFQAYESWRFDHEVTREMPELTIVNAPSALTVPAQSHRGSLPPRPLIRRRLKEGSSVGRLEVPRLKISVMVVEGVTERDLRLAAGHIPGTALPEQGGNVGIAGHRDSFFHELKNIQKNDKITFATRSGVFHYAVESLTVVEPSATEVLAGTGGSELTLVTCFPFSYVGSAPRRFIVRAARVD
ncbi:MAG TPA: class D sortase [Bryobacteraceae bacterium]